MTAGLLALHGLWTGICKPADAHNRRGYFQNELVDTALTRLYPGRVYDRLAPMPDVPEWSVFVRNVREWEGYEGGPWLVKTNVFTWPVWLSLDPVFVFVWRDVESVVRSAQKHTPDLYDDDQWQRIVVAHHAEQRRVKAMRGGFDIETPRLLAGDFSQVEVVLTHIGIPFDEAATEAFVDPAIWHGK